MKKIIGVVLVCMLSCIFVACGGSKKETAICTYSFKEYGMEYEMIMEAEDDIIHTMTQNTTINLSYYEAEDASAVEANWEKSEKSYENIDGVVYEAKKDGKYLYEKVIIDMSNEKTVEVLQYNGLLPMDGISNKASLDKLVKSLKSQGWTVEVTKE